MRIKINVLLILSIAFILVLSGCSADSKEPGNVLNGEDETEKLAVVATLFPQYDFARIIGGDKVNVSLLLPPGVEAHSYEPTPQDMAAFIKSDIFFFTGEGMEPWAVNIAENLVLEGVGVVDLSQGIPLLEAEEEIIDTEEEDHEEHSFDPHYWTDPNMAMLMIDQILQEFKELDPENAVYFEGNAQGLKEELAKLDEAIRYVISKSESRTILSGGHFAFGYFAHRYGLDHLSPYEGFSPNAEPSPQSITKLVETIRRTNAGAIFFEELADPKVARVISDETGVKMLMLHGVHNISQDDIDSGRGYLDIMYSNLENLKIGLGYHE
jgi:zinc transport system substrate-binding protein